MVTVLFSIGVTGEKDIETRILNKFICYALGFCVYLCSVLYKELITIFPHGPIRRNNLIIEYGRFV